MAYQIFFCDDDAEASAIYLPKIKAAFKAYLEHVTITAFRSPARLIEHIRNGNSCDLLFVDIDMPEMNGIELCRSLQAQGHSIPVVFFSNMEERVFETFEFPTVFFLRKRFFHNELQKVVQRALREAVRKRETVLLSAGTQSYRLAVSDVKYLEIMDQMLSVFTVNGQIVLRYKMESAEQLLLPYGFLRVHKSYLVNYNYIHSIQREELRLTDGTRIPVSRRRFPAIQDAFLRLTSNEIRDEEGL